MWIVTWVGPIEEPHFDQITLLCMQNLLIMMIAVVLVLVLVYLCVFQIIVWKIYDIVAFDGNSKKRWKSEREFQTTRLTVLMIKGCKQS